ncbi:MAG TPA: RNA polymerase sigma factor [Chthonomonadaceae bacterium]|nr:RNA polymerase sigma factor [Chthonomonadaceae bacterium]
MDWGNGGSRRRESRDVTAETAWERRLVARLQAGEPEALNMLFEMHVDRVYAYSRHLLGNVEDAEEVTSEAFLRAFEKAATFRGDSPFRGWLFGIVRNLCRDRQSQPRLVFLEPEEAERQAYVGREQAQVETGVVVRRALAELPEEQRLTLILCDVEQWDAREVAEMIERSVPATKSLLYRARRALRSRLTELWADEEKEDAV